MADSAAQPLAWSHDLIGAALRGSDPCWPADAPAQHQQRFLDIACHHRVEALLFDRLSPRPAWRSWPETLRRKLARAARDAAVRDTQQGDEQIRLLQQLSQAGIEAVVFKGGALAYSHYPDPALRPRDDLDLLIRRADIERIDNLMASLGYECPPGIDRDRVMHQFIYLRRDHTGWTHNIDFHWKISNRKVIADSLGFEELWRSGQAVAGAGGRIRTPHPVESLILACLHRIAHHGNDDRLIWLYDIHLLLAALSAADVERLLRLVEQKRLTAVCARGIGDAAAVFNTPLPAAIQRRWLQSATPGRGEPSRHLLRPGCRRVDYLWSDLLASPGVGAKALFLLRNAFPPAAYMRQRYADSHTRALPVLYARRLWRGLRKLAHPG